MPPTFKSEYQELVDAPNETLEVEYKSWLDLSENGARADLARHIAAIAIVAAAISFSALMINYSLQDRTRIRT